MSEFSIVMAGDLACNMLCSYCSATGIAPEDFEKKKKSGCKVDLGKPKWDWDAIKKVFDTNPIIQEALKNNQELTLNFWGSEPLLWIKECDKYTDWIDKTYPKLKYKLFISTNGILLGAKHIQEWIYKEHKNHGLELQLSHDGIGQFIRGKKFDPLYDPKTKDFCVKLVRDGILNMFNATLNQFNCSPWANKMYFDKWRFDNHLEKSPLLIKLNHNNDAEYTGPYRLSGENLDRYMHEMEMIYQQAYIVERSNNPDMNDTVQQLWQPYAGYLRNQMMRWQPFSNLGGCGAFSTKQKDWTWCINSLGEYVFCQLCNNPEDNPNPDCARGPECKDCEFGPNGINLDDCAPCPDMVMPEHCEYKKAYARLMVRMKQFCAIIDSTRNFERDLINRINSQNKSCNCKNGDCR